MWRSQKYLYQEIVPCVRRCQKNEPECHEPQSNEPENWGEIINHVREECFGDLRDLRTVVMDQESRWNTFVANYTAQIQCLVQELAYVQQNYDALVDASQERESNPAEADDAPTAEECKQDPQKPAETETTDACPPPLIEPAPIAPTPIEPTPTAPSKPAPPPAPAPWRHLLAHMLLFQILLAACIYEPFWQ